LTDQQLEVILLSFPGRDKGSIKRINVSSMLTLESDKIAEKPEEIDLSEDEDDEF